MMRRRSAWLLALLAPVVGLAVMAIAPSSISRLLDDKTAIAFERTQRRLRYDLGLPMPGEPDLANFAPRLAQSGLAPGAPILIRIFKKEFELELWMQRDGAFQRFASYPICRWSGGLGPKIQQGDWQAPEGFYTVDAAALNPNSKWHRSFNLGYPNAFDRAKGRTGSLIMVHGGCASIGCFAMTNAQIDEIWRLVTDALSHGQKRFQVQVYPFRMSDNSFSAHADDANFAFWQSLKTGSDIFEATKTPPKVTVCRSGYQFAPGDRGSVGDAVIDERCPIDAAKS